MSRWFVSDKVSVLFAVCSLIAVVGKIGGFSSDSQLRLRLESNFSHVWLWVYIPIFPKFVTNGGIDNLIENVVKIVFFVAVCSFVALSL